MDIKLPPVIKENGAIIIGGVLGVAFIIYVLNKNSGSQSSSVQYSPAPQTPQVQYVQTPQVIYSNNGGTEGLQIQADIMKANIEAQSLAATNNTNLEFQKIQGDNAQKVGDAAVGIIAALSMPTINAINSSNQSDIAAITASVAALKAGASYETIVPAGNMTSVNQVNVADNVYNPVTAMSNVNYLGKNSPEYMQVYNNNTLTGIIESVNGVNTGYGVNNQGMVQAGANLAGGYAQANAQASGQSWGALGGIANNMMGLKF